MILQLRKRKVWITDISLFLDSANVMGVPPFNYLFISIKAVGSDFRAELELGSNYTTQKLKPLKHE